MDLNISLPHLYTPRHYQKEVFEAYNKGIRRFVLVWHRRSGKDKTMLNFMICRMFERVGTYWYVLPTYSQARKIIWEGMGSGLDEGMPFLDHFPEQLIEDKNETNLTLKLVNGSYFHLIGSDQIDRVVGTNPIGIIYSEYSLQSIAAWEFVSPMLTENKGWAAFIYTPRGRDHAFHLWEKAKEHPNSWFVSLKTIDDTIRDAEGEDGTPVIDQEALKEERDRGMEEGLIQQEYHCSFSGYREGSYYGPLMASAYSENRIREVPWNPRVPVFTAWDLGIADQCAIWFAQVEGREIYLIDFYQQNSQGILHFVSVCKNKPYVYSNHWAPHDIDHRMDTGSGGLKTRKQLAQEVGFNFKTVSKLGLMDGIDQARSIIPRCYFDKTKADMGIRSLINYHKDFNKKTLDYKFHPVHDKWSHGADAFRELAIIVDREISSQLFHKPIEYIREFDIFADTKQQNIYTTEPKYEILVEENTTYNKFGWDRR